MARIEFFQPVLAVVVDQVIVQVLHRDRARLIIVQLPVVVQVGVDRYAWQTWFTIVADTVAVFV